jgi:hypothetical protein
MLHPQSFKMHPPICGQNPKISIQDSISGYSKEALPKLWIDQIFEDSPQKAATRHDCFKIANLKVSGFFKLP